MTLADRCEAVLLERPMPAGTLAATVRKRKADVLETLHGNPDRFVHSGKRRASLWSVRTSSGYTVAELAARWGRDRDMASAIIFGREGFLERGLVQSLNGNGRVVVTTRGLRLPRPSRRWIRRRRREREPDLRRLRRRLQNRAVERGNTTRAGTEEESIAVSSPPCASCPQCRSVSPPPL